ncbi:MAG: hypothetical protein ABIH89_01380 [Elusimicrobiota bacterium]
MNIKLLIITHGNLCEVLRDVAADIIGPDEDVMVYGIYRNQCINDIRSGLESLISGILEENAVLVLTDMFGGTPSNIAIPFIDNKNVEIVTGANLPMLVTACSLKKRVQGVRELAEKIFSEGVKSIIDCRSRMKR